jgi:hypothetical protein
MDMMGRGASAPPMKALVLQSAGTLVARDIDTPSPRPGEVLVRVTHTGICGTGCRRGKELTRDRLAQVSCVCRMASSVRTGREMDTAHDVWSFDHLMRYS